MVGARAGSAVMWTVWVTVGAEGTLSICVVPELSGRVDGENAALVSRMLVFPALPVLKSAGSTVEGEG